MSIRDVMDPAGSRSCPGACVDPAARAPRVRATLSQCAIPSSYFLCSCVTSVLRVFCVHQRLRLCVVHVCMGDAVHMGVQIVPAHSVLP